MSTTLKKTQGEVISSLRQKNLDLSAKFKEATAILDSYKRGELGAESKIKSLNDLHSQKVKALLKSIQTLKKDLQREKLEQKDHIRAQRIENLKKELGDQELIINTLRNSINDDDKADKAILDTLNKGPPRIRVATREELKMDIKKLKNQVLVLRNKTKEKQENERKGDTSGLEEEKEMNDQMIDLGNKNKDDREKKIFNQVKEELEQLNHQLNLDLNSKNQQILDLFEQMEEQKIEIEARDMNIEQFKSQVNNLHQQIRGLRSLENDLKMLATKKIALEEENEKLRTHINERFLLKEEENLDQNEMELENRGLLEKLALLQDQLESERLNSRTQAENQSKENENLLSKIRKLEEDLKKLKQEKQNLGSSKTEIEKRFREKIATLEEQVAQTKEKLESDQEELKTLRSERRAKDEEINRLEEELKNLQEEFDDRIVEIEVYQTKISDLEKINESLTLELKDAEVKGSSVVDPHTVADQKKKIKDLTRREVELLEEIDELKERNAEDREKTAAKHLLVTQKRSTSTGRMESEFKTLQRKYEESQEQVKRLQNKLKFKSVQ